MEPLMNLTAGNAQLASIIRRLGDLFWSTALLRADQRKAGIQEIVDEIGYGLDSDVLRNIISAMIERHERMFPWLHGAEE